jgi:hypothetical protein
MENSKLINLIIALAMVLLTLLSAEYIIENYLISATPVKFQFSLPQALSVLSQSSKQHRIPENYIAIIGDSYAQGKGDWFLDNNPNANEPFHSAHVINQLTQKDVISFGKSGASNIEGWVREPIAKSEFIHNKISSDFVKPEIVLAYFYAGNDITENVLQVEEDLLSMHKEAALSDTAIWDEYFSNEVERRKVAPYSNHLGNTGWLLRSIFKIIKNELKSDTTDEEVSTLVGSPVGAVNRVLVKAQEVGIPDGLQSPSLELSKHETELGFLAFKQSLRYLKRYYPDSQLAVVYIPSVLASYNIASNNVKISGIETSHKKLNRDIYSKVELSNRSDELANKVESIATQQNVAFIDTRPQIRASAALEIIHGPKDWRHFNRKGYEALSLAITCGLIEKNMIKPNKQLHCLH